MQIDRFIQVLNENRDMLQTKESPPWPEKACGCPLWVVVEKTCREETRFRLNYMGHKIYGSAPVNPDPESVADVLRMPMRFAAGVAQGWDMAVYYDDAETDEDWRHEFSGFLISLPLTNPSRIQRLLPVGRD